MFAIVVRFDLRDAEAAAAFDGLLADALPSISADEPGTLVYATHQVEDDPLARVFYELYVDRDAHLAHEANPSTAAFLAAIKPHVAEVRVDFLTDPTGKAVPAS